MNEAHQKAKARNLHHLYRDRGYRFADRDPVMIEVTEIITNSTLSLKQIETKSGVCVSTMKKWMDGTTRRPLNITIDFVLRVLGYRRGITPLN
jgi:hypothetical protein